MSPEKQRDYTREHVDLVMEAGHRHGITRLEAFRLMGYQQPWHRFWVIEFPTFEGAEEWIQAEMAPPYGSHGYWEYYLARPWGRDYFSTWVTRERKPMPPLKDQEPGSIPGLQVDRESVVVLMFGRGLPGSDLMSVEERGDREHVDLMKQVAREHGLMRLEGFRLIAPQGRLAPRMGDRVPDHGRGGGMDGGGGPAHLRDLQQQGLLPRTELLLRRPLAVQAWVLDFAYSFQLLRRGYKQFC